MTTLIVYLALLAVAANSNSGAFPECVGSCCDKHESCAFWARNNECKKNPEWMLPNCQLSCHACPTTNLPEEPKQTPDCIDKDESCAMWARNGECQKNPGWMLSNCQLSCKACKKDNPKQIPGCVDKDENCPLWASNNECINNPTFMMRNCKLSCNACAPKPRPQPLESCRNSGMTTETRRNFLEMHNKYRSLVAKGQAKDGYGGNAPRAARMKKMVYDCAIEINAMKNAKQCVIMHSPEHEREDLGENLYWTTNLRVDKTKAADYAMEAWFNELAKYGVGSENVLENHHGRVLHYTQMVWQDTDRLGCFVEWCPHMTYVVCQYGPKGNWIGDPIYELGEPCTSDKDCSCYNCKCSREEALCIVQ